MDKQVRLELRLLADVGLVGYPNTGKSTLLSRVSAARPRIADYPFTTLVPQLGVVRLDDQSEFVMADIPGLIEGAHAGRGLGDRFLRHIKRTAVLLHVLDLAADRPGGPMDDYDKIRSELGRYDPGLLERPQAVAANKIDLTETSGAVDQLDQSFREQGIPFFAISAVTGAGIAELTRFLYEMVMRARSAEPVVEPEEEPVLYTLDSEEEIGVAAVEPGVWRASGGKLERVVAMTDFDNQEAVDYLRGRLERMDLDAALLAAGARPGDEVVVGETRFEFEPGAAGQTGEGGA